MAHSTTYTVGFAALICGFWGTVVSVSYVNLKPYHVKNKRLDQQKQVLAVAGLIDPAKPPAETEINALFDKRIEAEMVKMGSADPVADIKPAGFDQQKAKKDPAQSSAAPPNSAKVLRLPTYGKIYKVLDEQGKVDSIVIPVEGYGLWSTLLGYLALEEDGNTVKGITYYDHKETPGLGGEVDNPLWKAKWPGRKVYGPDGKVAIKVAKGQHGPPDKDPYAVDALSGATITSNGVTNMMHFWFGPEAFGPYLSKIQKGQK